MKDDLVQYCREPLDAEWLSIARGLLLGVLLLLVVLLLLLVLRVTFFAWLLFWLGLTLRLAMLFVRLLLLCTGRSGDSQKQRQNCYADNSNLFHRGCLYASLYAAKMINCLLLTIQETVDLEAFCKRSHAANQRMTATNNVSL